MNLRQALAGKLTRKEMASLRTSFDIVGDIAIMEIPPELTRKQKAIAEAVMKIHRNVKTVCKKGSARKGKLRLRVIKYIAGRRSTETVHMEYGCRYKLDVRKVYFSPRESTERERIAGQVKDGETVLVMFAGVGPFSVLIARRKKAEVYSVEMNRDACRYARENMHLNSVAARSEVLCGDVRKACRPLYGRCDRVVMPLPHEGYRYLGIAFKCLRPSGGIIHFYYAGHFEVAEKHIKEVAGKLNRKAKVVRKVRVLPYSPGVWKICLDVKVT